MIISHTHKFIFVKTRKTAGSSIEKYLVDYYFGPEDVCTGSDMDSNPRLNTASNNGHLKWNEIAAQYPKEWQWYHKNYYKFAVERNPWEKLVSMYWFYKSYRPTMVQQGFEDFLDKHIEQCNDWDMYAQEDELKVDCLIDYADLHNAMKTIPVPYADELSFVRMKSGISQSADYREMYNSHTRKSVEQVFQKPIQHFGYTFT